MKKFFFFVAILLLLSSYAMAADYWHFGIGLRAIGVAPRGNEYHNAIGEGIVLTFGDPDSRFTTHFELDNWSVKYDRPEAPITVWGVAGDSSTLLTRSSKFEYSGLAVAFCEKYRTYQISPVFSNYVIAGIGGYFLDAKFEESHSPLSGSSMISRGFFSVITMAAGTGFDGRINDHVTAFVEGRFVGLLSKPVGYTAPDMFHGYFGVRYVF